MSLTRTLSSRSFGPARIASSALLLLALALLSAIPTGAASERSDLATLSLYDPLLPEVRDEIVSETEGLLPVYEVSAVFHPVSDSPASIEGTTQLTYVNFTGVPQREVYLRLYPNGPSYPQNGLTLSEVLVNGEPVSPGYEQDDTLAIVPLEIELAPEGVVDLSISFTSTIPIDPDDSYSMFAYESSGGSYNLAYWQPLIAGWTPSVGWNTGPIEMRGDPVFSNTALFSVQLAVPTDLVFATTGMETGTTVLGDLTLHQWESGPSRDFVMIANPGFLVKEGRVGYTNVRTFYTEDTEELAAEVLDVTMASLEYFNEHFGPYPYQEFDLAQARIGPRAAGIEFPGLVYISQTLYRPNNPDLEFTIAHEVAHQWWYAIIGNNQYLHAFLDESLANYTSILYLEDRYGVETADAAINRYLKRSYFSTLFSEDGDAIVDQPTGSFLSDRTYGRIVYGKGALGMHAIREAIGLDNFTAGLHQYVSEHRFGVAAPRDLLQALEEASGTDLAELWRHWFDAAEGAQDYSPDDIIEIG